MNFKRSKNHPKYFKLDPTYRRRLCDLALNFEKAPRITNSDRKCSKSRNFINKQLQQKIECLDRGVSERQNDQRCK